MDAEIRPRRIRFRWPLVFASVASAAWFPGSGEAADPLFEFKGQRAEAFELLDLSGDGSMRLVEDVTVPPGYGPRVLDLRGGLLLAFARTGPLSAGTILVLWREMDARNSDADGVILLAAKYGADLTQAHNTRARAPHIWLEQDTDQGLQFRCMDRAGKESILGEVPGLGLTCDPWNKVGWFWQKVTFDGKTLRAKFWSFVDPEPAQWHLTTDAPGEMGGRIGLRGSSGHFRVAYYAASSQDLAVRIPDLYLHTAAVTVLPRQAVVFRVFASPAVARKTAACAAVIHTPEGEDVKWDLAGHPLQRASSFELPIHLTESARKALELVKTLPPAERARQLKQKRIPSFPAPLLDHNWPTLDQLHAGRYRVTLTLADAEGGALAEASHAFDVRSADALRARLMRITEAIGTAKKLARMRRQDGVEYRDVLLAAMTAQRFLYLVDRRIAAGRLDEVDAPLTYAENALRAFPQLAFEAEEKTP